MKTTYSAIGFTDLATLGRGVLCYAWLFFGLLSGLQAQPAPSLEYKIKATFLFNFTQFIDWPTASFAAIDAPFVIGILGEDPFGAYLDETVTGEKKEGHPLMVQRYRDITQLKPCHILFVQAGYQPRLRETLLATPTTGLLTVSDAPDFIGQGGIIRFYTQNSKIRIQINPKAAKAAELTVSSKLLRVADIYTP